VPLHDMSRCPRLASGGAQNAPRSAVLLLTCALGLATGLALLGAATALREQPVADLRPTDANVAVARRFYAAANHALRTGDPTSLDDLVAVNLAEHPARPVGGGGRSGLVSALLARRAAFPGLRLAVEALHPVGDDRVLAHVRAEGPAAGSFLGLGVPPELGAWGPLEVLRIADGWVVERWDGRPDSALFEPLGWAALPANPQSTASSSLVLLRLNLAPRASVQVETGAGPQFVVVEVGAATVESEAGVPGRPLLLAAGNTYFTPSGAPYALRNPGSFPAQTLVVRLLALEETTPGVAGAHPVAKPPIDWKALPATRTPGVATQILTGVGGVQPPAGGRLAVGRIRLAPGADLALSGADGPLVVAVETGEVEVAVADGRVWGTGADGRVWPPLTRASLTAGDGARLSAGAGATLRADTKEPAVLLVVTLTAPGSTPEAERPAPGAPPS